MTEISRDNITKEYIKKTKQIAQKYNISFEAAIRLLLVVEERLHVEQHSDEFVKQPNARDEYIEFYAKRAKQVMNYFSSISPEDTLKLLITIERRMHVEKDAELTKMSGPSRGL